MRFIETEIEGLFLIKPEVLEDNRGQFFRVYDKKDFAAIELKREFVQWNHSINSNKGTWRGLHFQFPPFTETKLIRCIRGKIYDVILDIRRNSKTFLKWKSYELSAANKEMIVVPDGCAHGFQTLEDNSEILYHHTAFYEPSAESGIRFDDSVINLTTPLPVSVISERDQTYKFLTDDFKGIEL